MKTVQNEVPEWEDIQPVIDDIIVETVHSIFEAVTEHDPLDDLFDDLSNRLIEDLKANSILEYNLELTDDQKEHLRKCIKTKGQETVSNYLANLQNDPRRKKAYGTVREKTTEIADAVLSSIGREINRGAVIDARAVQANSKNEKYDEILLRKSKHSGDITVPTSCILISTNCVEVIKKSCQEEKDGDVDDENETKKPSGKDTGKTSAKPG
jgi:hypothetical protein